ncbi:MAG: hypothetical protein ACE5DW_06125 [Thermodesulfobacteriota bacterium]
MSAFICIKNNRGRLSLKAVIWILIISAVLYTGYKLYYPVFSYYMLKTDVGEEIKLAHMHSDDDIRRRVARRAYEWSVPIKAEDVMVSHDFDNIHIKIKYSETIVFLGRYKKTFVFKINASGRMKERSGLLR